MKGYESIYKMIVDGDTDEAISQLNEKLNTEKSDTAFYLLGNAYRKKGDFTNALNCYLEAVAINPDSPAKEAHSMLMSIMEFYHKDYYNP